MSGREVWVTGVGAVSAAGVGAASLLRLLRDGRSGVRPLPALNGRPGGGAPTPEIPRAGRRLDRSAQLFLAAGLEAWLDAGLAESRLARGVTDTGRYGVLEGSSLGPMADLLGEHERDLAGSRGSGRRHRPSALVRFMPGAGGATLAQAQGLQGPVFHISAGSVSAAYAVAEAARKISGGDADLILAGGAECPLHPDIVSSFEAAGILGPGEPGATPCRPFDTGRTGTVLGEGSGALVLEGADHAARRGARARAVVAGWGWGCDSGSMTEPDPNGLAVARASCQALDGTHLSDIGWIKAHGTGTRRNDAAECRGLAAVFGHELRRIPITSLKSSLGHCLGACGAVEGVATVLALASGLIPRTVGTEQVDPELPPCRIATEPAEAEAGSVLLLAESFGGRCSALVLRRP